MKSLADRDSNLETSVYPEEIQACLAVKFEDPPDEFRTILERIRTYKMSNSDEILDFGNNQEFRNVILED